MEQEMIIVQFGHSAHAWKKDSRTCTAQLFLWICYKGTRWEYPFKSIANLH